MIYTPAAYAQATPVCTTETVGSEEFFGISGSSDSNVIGVGDNGIIYRNNGSGWAAMTSPTSRDLNDVEVVNATTAFAVGDNGTILQLVGANWIEHTGVTGRAMYGVWAASATEAYVVGDRGEIWIYNGITWTDASGPAGTDNRDLEDVWGDANNVYAMSDRGELYIYNRASGTWAPRDDACRQGNNFEDLWGDGAGNIYLVRREDVYRYNGGSCAVVATASDRLYGIYGSNDGQIYAGGRDGVVMRFDGSSWTESTEATQDINDVWVSPSGTAYYGGDGAEITTCTVAVPNVVADWPLDDCTLGFDGSVVLDNGPNGLNGVTAGGVTVEANGQLCSAAGLNGSSAYVRVADTAALDFADAMSFAVWVRHNGGLSDWQAIFAKGDNSYRLHLNGGCGIADTLPGNTRHGITFGLNGGCGGADLNSNVVPTPGVWYHVAGTYDRSVMQVYINGNLVSSANYSAAINNSAFDLFIGENSQNRGRYWNGDIDELTFWDGVISAQEVANHMNRTRPCTACAAAEFVINHDNNGIHCLDETVQVSVVDAIAGLPFIAYNAEVTLDTQTGNGTWSLVSGSGTLTDATADDGVATYQWPLGEDTAVFALSYRQGTATFDIDVYQTSDPGIRDTDAEGLMTFGPSGFTVTAAPLSNPPPALIVPFAAAQTAAVDFPVYLTAYGQTANDPVCGVIESYDGTRNLQVWYDYVNPVAGSIAPSVDGVAAAVSEAAAGTQPIVFSNGQAAVTGRYKDAGQIRLHFNDDNIADPNLPNGIRGATAGFVSRPATFVLSGIEDPGGNPNTAPADASGAPFVAAGTPFTVTVTALDADGDITPNYGRETTPETVGLTANLVSPAAGSSPPINFSTGFGAFTGGQATGTDFSWPEVGIITLTPAVGDGNYLGAGNVIGTMSENIGRFIPDHFVATTNAPAFATACTAGSFSYIGQAFPFATQPVITLTASAADGSPTVNYVGNFFRIDNSTLANRTYTAVSGNLDTGNVPPTASDPVVASLGNGVGSLTFDVGAGLSFVKAAEEVPFNAEVSLSIDVFDSDGVAALTNAVTFGATGGIAFNAGSEMRFGRLRLENALGSELVNLQMPMIAEYFEDPAIGYVPNADDSCTTDVTLALGAFTGNLGVGETCAIENGSPGDSGIACAGAGPAGLRYREPPLAGDFNLNLLAPGNGNDGSVTVTATVPAWLQFDWNAAVPGLENPAGTATFGIFRGEDRRIYTREIY
jgi:MSHA biogenesis protein MshQ